LARAEHEGISRCTWPSITTGAGGAQLRDSGSRSTVTSGLLPRLISATPPTAPGDHVRDHVDAARQQLARHVRVVRRQVVRLRVRGMSSEPGSKKNSMTRTLAASCRPHACR
jgi:hypothetical protein